MKALRWFALAIGTIASVALFGCGKSGSPVATTDASLDGGVLADGTTGAQALEAVQLAMQTADSSAIAPLWCGAFGFPQGVPRGCDWDAASGSFVCGPDTRRDGLTELRSYQFLDGAGVAQQAYDTLTTASIRFQSHLYGTREHGRWRSIDDTRDLVESGLAGAETTRLWNGTGHSMRQDSVNTSGTAALVTREATTTVTDVSIPSPWRRDSWPLSGTLRTRLVTSSGVDLTSTITFNGTRYVPMVVGDSTYTVDLARGTAHHGRGWGHGGPGGRH